MTREKELGEIQMEKEMEEKREEVIKQELDKPDIIVAQEEEVKRASEEVTKKQKWTEEREGALMSKPNDEAAQETLADKVLKRLMQRECEKEREEEEKRRLEERKKELTLRLSLFPNMPLYINFVTANSLTGIKGKNMPESLKSMGWHVWAATGKNAVPDKSQNEGWTIQSKTALLIFFYLRRDVCALKNE